MINALVNKNGQIITMNSYYSNNSKKSDLLNHMFSFSYFDFLIFFLVINLLLVMHAKEINNLFNIKTKLVIDTVDEYGKCRNYLLYNMFE